MFVCVCVLLQPAHGTLYEYRGKPLIFVSDGDARVAILKTGHAGLKKGTTLQLTGSRPASPAHSHSSRSTSSSESDSDETGSSSSSG
jgi:hypothetical protein